MKKLNKIILTLSLAPMSALTLYTASNANQTTAHADPTFHYIEHPTNKEMYEATGETAAQRKADFKAKKAFDKKVTEHVNKEHAREKANKKSYNNSKEANNSLNKNVKKNKAKRLKRSKKSFYYVNSEIKSHSQVKSLKKIIAYKGKSNFKPSKKNKVIKKGSKLKVIKVVKYKHVYLFELKNHTYVTANKSFVKLIK